MKFILVSIGTKGDVLPFMALGRALAARGHAVRLLSNEDHAEKARRFGLDFAAIAHGPFFHTGSSAETLFETIALPSFAASFTALEDSFLSDGDPIVIAHDIALGAQFACESLGIPYIRVVLSPCGIAATRRTPEEPSSPVELAGVNRLRTRLDLDAWETMREAERFPALLTLCLFSEEFADPRGPLPDRVRFAGFPLVKHEDRGLDAELSTFLARRENHIVAFTPGTGVTDVADFFDVGAGACRKIGADAVFLSPHISPSRYEAEKSIMVRDFVDLGDLLPHVSLLVHHGGIGTTAQAIHAGIPQLIKPDRFDQPDNAARVARLGLGSPIDARDFQPETLSKKILDYLPDRISRSMPRSIQAEDAISLSIKEIEKIIKQSSETSPPYRKYSKTEHRGGKIGSY
jgi:rhamnosyltransferase subunit B